MQGTLKLVLCFIHHVSSGKIWWEKTTEVVLISVFAMPPLLQPTTSYSARGMGVENVPYDEEYYTKDFFH
ncbi:hypothetical protein ACS0TY_036810 [Phlomoides rotata]